MNEATRTSSRRTFLRTIGAAGTGLSSTVVPAAADPDGGSTTPARAVRTRTDVVYATRDDGAELVLDLAVPTTDGSSPLVVYIHGGSWVAGDEDDTPDLRYFAERGYATASVEYRLAPENPAAAEPPIVWDDDDDPRAVFPAQIRDVKAAIRWLRAHSDEYGLDPGRVAVWGSSAGAHLAALAGTTGDGVFDAEIHPRETSVVQAVVDWYGPTNFLLIDEQLDGSGFSHDAPNSPESMLIGGQITENEAAVRRADPITYLDPDDPPFLIMHGRRDTTVPIGQSEVLFEALRENCVEASFYELHDLGHGFGFPSLAEQSPDAQTFRWTPGCERESGAEAPSGEQESHGPSAGAGAIERFLDRQLGG